MARLIISLHDNNLKITLNDKSGLQTSSVKLEDGVTNGSHIANTEAFAASLNQLLEAFENIKKKELELLFLVEPDDAYLRFVTVNKNGDADVDTQVINGIKEKLEGVSLDELYFAYQKIAPFVYQFVGVKKQLLDSYLETSTSAGIPLAGVMPWVLLLPKFLNSNDPCVFISKTNGAQTVALAELNGVYFCETYSTDRSADEIKELVEQLSVYKRSKPINKVYTLGSTTIDLGDDYEVAPLLELSDEYREAKGFDLHLLSEEVLGGSIDYLSTQVNLLNLLPVPAVESKASVAVYAGAFATALLLVAGGFFAYSKLGDSDATPVSAPESGAMVLSNQTETAQSTPSASNDSNEGTKLLRSDLRIRVENGAGIAGIAAQTQQTLEDLGYTVASIGNFEGDTQQETVITLKTSTLNFKDTLVSDLENDFSIVVKDGLDEDLEYDALLVVGSN